MAKETQSLADYMRAKKREACAVCQLPDDVRGQLEEAKERGILLRHQLEWLRTVIGADIARQELISHRTGGHDEP
jgi:hypothetical protein